MKKIVLLALAILFGWLTYGNYGPDYKAKVRYKRELLRGATPVSSVSHLAWVDILENKGLELRSSEISADGRRANLEILSGDAKKYEAGKIYYAYEINTTGGYAYFVLKKEPSRTNFWFFFCFALLLLDVAAFVRECQRKHS